jgi:hypothetical protein
MVIISMQWTGDILNIFKKRLTCGLALNRNILMTQGGWEQSSQLLM